jgi:hypothetical protein
MPTISIFYGIYIMMYFRDHAPPHFHASYGAHEALIDIRSGAVISGSLPRSELKLVQQWAADHKDELLQNWNLCRSNQHPNQIAPLA